MFASMQRRLGDAGAAPQINLAPLMDLVFILLIFFLVTATFLQDAGIPVQRPEATWSQALDTQALRVAITADGALYVEGERTDLPALQARFARFKAARETASVVLIPDRQTLSGRLVQILDAAKQAGIGDVAIATRRRES